MKTIYLSILFALGAITLSSGQVISKAEDAFASGDAAALASVLDTKITLSIDDEVKILKAADAQQRIKTFFSNHKPSKYVQKHEGADRNKTSKYAIGVLTTSNGSYRIYIYVETSESKEVIRELRLESL